MRQAPMIRLIAAVGICLGLAAGTSGCDEPDSGGESSATASDSSTDEGESHPAAGAARAFLEAVQYRDVEGAWSHHRESTKGGVYCSSEAFREILERTKEKKTEGDCQGARDIGPRRRASLEEDAELLLQVLRFVCEMPEGTCRDYARKVFESQLPETEFWSRVENFEVVKVRPEGGEADVYIDYWRGNRESAKVHHRTLELKKREGEWLVTDVFGAEAVEQFGR